MDDQRARGTVALAEHADQSCRESARPVVEGCADSARPVGQMLSRSEMSASISSSTSRPRAACPPTGRAATGTVGTRAGALGGHLKTGHRSTPKNRPPRAWRGQRRSRAAGASASSGCRRVSRWAAQPGQSAETRVRFHPVRVVDEDTHRPRTGAIDIDVGHWRRVRVAPGLAADDLRRVLAISGSGRRADPPLVGLRIFVAAEAWICGAAFDGLAAATRSVMREEPESRASVCVCESSTQSGQAAGEKKRRSDGNASITTDGLGRYVPLRLDHPSRIVFTPIRSPRHLRQIPSPPSRVISWPTIGPEGASLTDWLKTGRLPRRRRFDRLLHHSVLLE
jgi:hypothetical protein